ncbi:MULTISPECIES: response regulator [unclassified Clostridium]|uniref:response regulator transcription factor n=1 Tax=unclassified Clostridium TaxID=2614128 RepID=UPI00189B8A00|nr:MULTISPECIES: response regulator [unclassified Clostridium]MCR1951741.1 response regulator [Clostridium sp. DSM 100503]
MLNILVVEDEGPIRDWIGYTIKNISEDFNIVGSVSNGKEAYDIVLKSTPDVIITDIKMPVMDGIELSKRIKEVAPEVYIIILTNFAEFSYAKEAISCGVYEYLIKSDIRPKELSEILHKINEIIKSKVRITTEEKLDKQNIIKSKVYSRSIEKALKYIEDNYKKHISLMDVSKHIYLSHEYFSRLFKEEVGENFSTYLTIYRINKAKELIKNTDMKISQVALEVGYSNAGYFSKNYKKYTGISPEEDRY